MLVVHATVATLLVSTTMRITLVSPTLRACSTKQAILPIGHAQISKFAEIATVPLLLREKAVLITAGLFKTGNATTSPTTTVSQVQIT